MRNLLFIPGFLLTAILASWAVQPIAAGESYPEVVSISKAHGWKSGPKGSKREGGNERTWHFQDDEKMMQASDLNGDGAIDYLRLQSPPHSFNHSVWIDTDHDGFFDKTMEGRLEERIAVPTLPGQARSMPHGVVIMIAKVEGQELGTIRLTIENRGTQPAKVIRPADIHRPWGPRGWWSCGSYRFYLLTPRRAILTYTCDQPPPPAARPQPNPPDIVELEPGQSVGTLFSLPLPRPQDGIETDTIEHSATPSPFWTKAEEGTRILGLAREDPPDDGYALKVIYRPLYEPASLTRLPEHTGKNSEDIFFPPANQVVVSNTLSLRGSAAD